MAEFLPEMVTCPRCHEPHPFADGGAWYDHDPYGLVCPGCHDEICEREQDEDEAAKERELDAEEHLAEARRAQAIRDNPDLSFNMANYANNMLRTICGLQR